MCNPWCPLRPHCFYFFFFFFSLGKRLGVWRDQVHKREVSSPSECTLHSLCGGESCSTWPGFRRFIFFFPYPPLSSLFTQGDTDVPGQSRQADAQILTGGKSYSYSWTGATAREPTGGVGWGASLSAAAAERGVGSNEERRFCFALFPPSTPPSHISKDCETRWIHTLPFFLPPRYFCVHFSSSHSAWKKTPYRFGGREVCGGAGAHSASVFFSYSAPDARRADCKSATLGCEASRLRSGWLGDTRGYRGNSKGDLIPRQTWCGRLSCNFSN